MASLARGAPTTEALVEQIPAHVALVVNERQTCREAEGAFHERARRMPENVHPARGRRRVQQGLHEGGQQNLSHREVCRAKVHDRCPATRPLGGPRIGAGASRDQASHDGRDHRRSGRDARWRCDALCRQGAQAHGVGVRQQRWRGEPRRRCADCICRRNNRTGWMSILRPASAPPLRWPRSSRAWRRRRCRWCGDRLDLPVGALWAAGRRYQGAIGRGVAVARGGGEVGPRRHSWRTALAWPAVGADAGVT
mmetsp:Transcript_84988/g.245767  ORF Transcript_84988/g.245767 Transcript_84988/m.245767 type:complete len:252 (+) Transcript_84988:239-994(+)